MESRAIVPKKNMCIDCKIALSLTPISKSVSTIDRELRLSSSAKLGLKDVELSTVEDAKLEQPQPQFFPRGIKWQYFPAGRKVSGTVAQSVDEGSLQIIVLLNLGEVYFSSATLMVFPEFSACETRNIVFKRGGLVADRFGDEKNAHMVRVDEPFHGNITVGTRCIFFGVPAGLIPKPLCDAGHNIIAKRDALALAERRQQAEARRVPRDVLAVQGNTVLCDPWGPPVKAAAAAAAPRPYSCAGYLDAIVDFARGGRSAVTEHLQRWDDATLSAVLAVCAAGHDRLGSASPLGLLPPPVLRRVVLLAFPCRMTALPKWTYIDAVASRIQPHLQAPLTDPPLHPRERARVCRYRHASEAAVLVHLRSSHRDALSRAVHSGNPGLLPTRI